MAGDKFNLHGKELIDPVDNARFFQEVEDETGKIITKSTTVLKFRNWLMSTAIFSTLNTVGKNIIGAINELKEGIDNNTKSIVDNTAQLNANTQSLTTHKTALVTDTNGVHGLKVESGTFSPTLKGATSGEVTYSARFGIYYKIGKVCFFNLNIQYSSINNAVGVINIGGLPFTTTNDTLVGLLTASLGTGSSKYLIAGTYGSIIKIYGQDGHSEKTISDLASSGWLNISGNYIMA